MLERLVEFAESGNQQKIALNGQNHQGWIMEITDEALMISTGFADKAGKDIWVEILKIYKMRNFPIGTTNKINGSNLNFRQLKLKSIRTMVDLL